MRFPYLKVLSQNFEILTPVVTSSTQKWVKKVQIGISCTNIDRKMKIKTKVKYSLIKPFSQYF